MGGLVVDSEIKLIIADTTTNTCAAVNPNKDFTWISELGVLIPLQDFKDKYNIPNKLSPEEFAFCQSYIKYRVAPNRDYLTRPMYDELFIKTKHRIKINKPCEPNMIRAYSARDNSRGYFFATNEQGYRGLVICQ